MSLPFEHDLSAHNLSRGGLDQAHDREVCDRFTASALSDYAEGLSLTQSERDSVNCLDDPFVGLEICLKVPDIQ